MYPFFFQNLQFVQEYRPVSSGPSHSISLSLFLSFPISFSWEIGIGTPLSLSRSLSLYYIYIYSSSSNDLILSFTCSETCAVEERLDSMQTHLDGYGIVPLHGSGTTNTKNWRLGRASIDLCWVLGEFLQRICMST